MVSSANGARLASLRSHGVDVGEPISQDTAVVALLEVVGVLGNWLMLENTGTPLSARLLGSTPRRGPLLTTDPPPMFSPEAEVGEAIAL